MPGRDPFRVLRRIENRVPRIREIYQGKYLNRYFSGPYRSIPGCRYLTFSLKKALNTSKFI